MTPSAVRTWVVGNELARRGGALDVVHRLDEVIDAEGNRGDQDHAEELEAGKDVTHGRYGKREAKV